MPEGSSPPEQGSPARHCRAIPAQFRHGPLIIGVGSGRSDRRGGGSSCRHRAQQTHSSQPAPPSPLAYIQPMGLMIGGHVTLIDHGYFSIEGAVGHPAQQAAVYAPLGGKVSSVTRTNPQWRPSRQAGSDFRRVRHHHRGDVHLPGALQQCGAVRWCTGRLRRPTGGQPECASKASPAGAPGCRCPSPPARVPSPSDRGGLPPGGGPRTPPYWWKTQPTPAAFGGLWLPVKSLG